MDKKRSRPVLEQSYTKETTVKKSAPEKIGRPKKHAFVTKEIC